MTEGVVKTQGSELYFIDDATSSDTDLVKMACPTGVQGLGGAKDQIETTCLDTVGDKEYEAGLGNPGQVTVPFNMIPRDHSHQVLFALKELGVTLKWLLAFSEGTNQPTVNDDQDFVRPTGRTSLAFSAFISDVNIDVANNEIVRGTLTLQRSGAVVPQWYEPA